MISDFRLHHGEGRVILDATLNRIAHDQAAAMAAKDVLDHDSGGSRPASRRRGPDEPRKISHMATTVSRKRSTNGLSRRTIARTCCCTTPHGSASPA